MGDADREKIVEEVTVDDQAEEVAGDCPVETLSDPKGLARGQIRGFRHWAFAFLDGAKSFQCEYLEAWSKGLASVLLCDMAVHVT